MKYQTTIVKSFFTVFITFEIAKYNFFVSSCILIIILYIKRKKFRWLYFKIFYYLS